MLNLGLLTITGPDAKKLLQGQLTCDLEKLVPGTNTLGALCNPQGRIISLFRLFSRNDGYDLVMLQSMIPITLAALKKYAIFYKVTLTDESNHLASRLPSATTIAYFNLDEGIPLIYPETSGKFLPHELALEKIEGAISFDKGCYTGQEIIARLHYRGKIKSHLEKMTLESATPLLTGEATSCGILVDAREKSYNLYDVLILVDNLKETK